MNRLLLILLAACTGMAAQANLAEQITTSWAKVLDSTAPDMGQNIAVGPNELYFMGNVGSTIGDGGSGFPKDYTDPTASIYYDGELIGRGAYYEGASHNLNFNLLKTDLDGRKQWCVYSTSGEVASNEGGVIIQPDGSVVVSFKMRHTLNMRTVKPTLIDGTGAEWTIDWTLSSEEDSRYYRGFVMKVDGNGGIAWIRAIDVSTAPQPNAGSNYTQGTWDALTLNSMVSDNNGNIYLAGRFVNPITLHGKDSSTTLTPHNTAGWNGDGQVSVGDLFVAKLDRDGYLTDVLTTTGKAFVESSPMLAINGDDMIINMFVKGSGDGTDAISLDGHEIALPTGDQCMVTAMMSLNFKVQWMRVFRSAPIKNKAAVMQNNHINIAGDNLWLTGMGNFTLTNEEGSETIATSTNNIREGYIIKCDLNTGQWVAAATSSMAQPGITGITGWLGGFETEDYFYTYGYNWGGLGVYLAEFDKSSLMVQQCCTLVKGGQQTIANEMVAKGNKLYTISRIKEVAVAGWELQTANSEATLHSMNWAALYAAFELPFNVIGTDDSISGDVNGDGEVNVADVNAIINLILDSGKNDRADVNGDGEINIADVNTLIDIVLNH